MNKSRYAKAFSGLLKNSNEKEIINRFISQHGIIKPGASVLDIGAGDGEIAGRLKKHRVKLLAIEPNEILAAKIRQRKIHCIQKTWERANMKQSFDMVIACHVVTYFAQVKLDKLVNKMIKVLKPGGKLIILTIHQTRGSWRVAHELIYKSGGLKKKKTSKLLQKLPILRTAKCYYLVSNIKTKTINKMLDILKLEFTDQLDTFNKAKLKLVKYLDSKTKHGQTKLDIVHQAIVYTKKEC